MPPDIDSGIENPSSAYNSNALFIMSKNASSTDKFDRAEVSKYGILPFSAHHSSAYYLETSRSDSLSNLLTTITNGNLFGYPGAACSRNPDFHL